MVADLALLGMAVSPGFGVKSAIVYGLGIGAHPAFIGGLTLLNLALIPVLFFVTRKASLRERLHSWLGGGLQGFLRKHKGFFRRYGPLALFLYTASPFPGTGVYSGVFITEALGINRKQAAIALAFGVVISALLLYLSITGAVVALNSLAVLYF